MSMVYGYNWQYFKNSYVITVSSQVYNMLRDPLFNLFFDRTMYSVHRRLTKREAPIFFLTLTLDANHLKHASKYVQVCSNAN